MRRPEFIARQGRHPKGWLGAIIGRIMAGETAAVNERAIEMLDIQPGDHVVDVGTGHGRSLGLIAKLADRGFVVGVDNSDVMLTIATKRNKALIRSGRVRVQEASSKTLPYGAGTFDKALAVHTLYFWNPVEPHLSSIANVLKPGASFVLGFRPAEDKAIAAKFPASIYTFRTTSEVNTLLSASGFEIVRSERRDVPGDTMVWLLTRRI